MSDGIIAATASFMSHSFLPALSCTAVYPTRRLASI